MENCAYTYIWQYFYYAHTPSYVYHCRSLETGVLIKGDNRRKEGEAHCHVGLAVENRGN